MDTKINNKTSANDKYEMGTKIENILKLTQDMMEYENDLNAKLDGQNFQLEKTENTVKKINNQLQQTSNTVGRMSCLSQFMYCPGSYIANTFCCMSRSDDLDSALDASFVELDAEPAREYMEYKIRTNSNNSRNISESRDSDQRSEKPQDIDNEELDYEVIDEKNLDLIIENLKFLKDGSYKTAAKLEQSDLLIQNISDGIEKGIKDTHNQIENIQNL